MKSCLVPLRAFAARVVPVLVLGLAGAAMAQTPRPAGLSHVEGSVVYAPAGATDWVDLPRNRAIVRGDRLWTDKGGRAEVQLGPAALHMDSNTFLEVTALDQRGLHVNLNLNEGTINARVRQREGTESFEIRTPQLTFRPLQLGDYRIDTDPVRGITRVTLRSGNALVFGAGSGTLALQTGQQITFAGNDLKVTSQATPRDDSFDRWASDRNRAADQAISARQVPRAVIAQQPQPNPQGHWEWISPWGWTWVQPRMPMPPPAVIVRPHYPPQDGGYWDDRGDRGWRRGYRVN